jgi:hypothetical protein
MKLGELKAPVEKNHKALSLSNKKNESVAFAPK